MKARLLVGIAALLGVGFICGIRPAVAIVGGAAQTGGDQTYHVVFILGSDNTECTGTVLTRELVLTAAQCIHAGQKYIISNVDSNCLSIPISVIRLVLHPNFDLQRLLNHLATVDLALLKLASPLPLNISKAIPEQTTSVGEHLTIIGYGVAEEGNAATGGILRAAKQVVTGVPSALQIRLVDPVTNGDTAGLGSCAGDLGGPAINESTIRLVGLMHWSTGPAVSKGCGGLTGLMPVAPHWDWIVRTAHQLGSPIGSDRQVASLPKSTRPEVAQTTSPASPPNPVTSSTQSPSISVPMQRQNGIYVVPVLINDAITLDFVVDSGAADVSIPADVVMTLMRTKTLKESDFLGEQTYVLADGSKIPSQTFRIRSLKVGNIVLENVIGSVASVKGSLLLGQSFLGRFKSWSVDNTNHVLVFE